MENEKKKVEYKLEKIKKDEKKAIKHDDKAYLQKLRKAIGNIYEDNNKEFKISNIKNNQSEKIFEQPPLKLRDDKKKGIIIVGAKEIIVKTFYDVFQILKKGELNRKKRETNKNDNHIHFFCE